MSLINIKEFLTQGATHLTNASFTALSYAKVHKVSNTFFATALGVAGYGEYLKYQYKNAADLTRKEIPIAKKHLEAILATLEAIFGIGAEDENNKAITKGTLEDIRNFLKDDANFKALSKKLTPEVLKARQEALKTVQGDIDSFEIDKINEMMVKIIDKVADALQTATLDPNNRDCADTLYSFLQKLKDDCKAKKVGELAPPLEILQRIVSDGNLTDINKLKCRSHLQQALKGLQELESIKDALGNQEAEGIKLLMTEVSKKYQAATDFNTSRQKGETDRVASLRVALLKPLAEAVSTALKENEGLDKMKRETQAFSAKATSYTGNVKYIRGLAAIILALGGFALLSKRIPALARNFPSVTRIG